LEDTYHDASEMNCVTVLIEEIKYYEEACKRKDFAEYKEYFEDKLTTVRFAKDSLVAQVDEGHIQLDSYIDGIKSYLALSERLSAQARR
jgi:CCR4-NOT transcriptional regulation complex NOT5 subunit